MSSTAQDSVEDPTGAAESALRHNSYASLDSPDGRPAPDGRRYASADIGIQQVVQVAVDRADSKTSLTKRPAGRPPAELMKRVLQASESLDPLAVVVALTEAGLALGLGECIDRVLLPAMRQIGIWWAGGRCSQQQEHSTTEAVRAWIDHASAFAPIPTHRAPVLLACGPRDRHTIALEALALLLRIQGWQCRVLGDRIPAAVLLTAAQATAPAAVVVVSHVAMNRGHALQSLAAVAAQRIPLFYAGNAFGTESARAHVPGRYLGSSVQHACTEICEVLGGS